MSEPQTTTRPALVRIGARTSPRLRLLCVPYAGAGTAAYRTFPQALPPWVEVWAIRLPARESRLAEPPLADIRSVVDVLVEELAGDEAFGPAPEGRAPLPYALLGHSMGALVCFELARALRRHELPQPAHLFVSGRRAPNIPDELPAIHRLPEAQFLAEVRRLGGIPDSVLAEPGLIDLIAPALRADFAVCETYRHTEEPPLPYGISAFGGRSDPTTTPEQLARWSEEADGPFTMRLYPGDHFFIHAHHRQILTEICRDIDPGQP
ncbi:medium-chain acyl-[acyl-carrier-protein] hydrolase [Saccharopolyspora shandongensis]|uniref:Medium-chain acyl-[acyl-carrier-protein] hydrolase n=1 Tax=Saccharopolyspora shandongensis TaxID=418495 RepID=A0A1H3BBV8_9PSEU|nr:alpha/beta fold hydrolase [Saccharopolyspora shandongensis]SDX39121.1 medium-chain acyl-[acyl-carrier-protein] hydrolase [Saccharopolyspora shandongensis]